MANVIPAAAVARLFKGGVSDALKVPASKDAGYSNIRLQTASVNKDGAVEMRVA
jgi:hypothetical protein